MQKRKQGYTITKYEPVLIMKALWKSKKKNGNTVAQSGNC